MQATTESVPTAPLMYPGPIGFLLILSFFYLEICDAKHCSRRRAERNENLSSRSLRISLSCWLSTWQLLKTSFSFDQSHPQRYLVHPIIWLIEQLKNVLQSESTVKSWWHESEVPNGRDQRLSFFRLSALRANTKNLRSDSRRKICQ